MKISNKIEENNQHVTELLDVADDMVSNLCNITPQSFDSFKNARKSFENKIKLIQENNQYVLERLYNLYK
jgi:hypothetical protein